MLVGYYKYKHRTKQQLGSRPDRLLFTMHNYSFNIIFGPEHSKPMRITQQIIGLAKEARAKLFIQILIPNQRRKEKKWLKVVFFLFSGKFHPQIVLFHPWFHCPLHVHLHHTPLTIVQTTPIHPCHQVKTLSSKILTVLDCYLWQILETIFLCIDIILQNIQTYRQEEELKARCIE